MEKEKNFTVTITDKNGETKANFKTDCILASADIGGATNKIIFVQSVNMLTLGSVILNLKDIIAELLKDDEDLQKMITWAENHKNKSEE